MTVVKDRRKEPFDDKYIQDKIRFRNLYIDRIRKAMHDKIASDSLENLGKGVLHVPLPKDTTHEPIFHHAEDGSFHKVFPGNVKFDVGDRIDKPPGGGRGRGGKPSDDGEGEDDFVWSEADVMEILFEGRSLPDLTKLKAQHVKLKENVHSGYTNKGPSHRMDMARTNKKRRNEEMILTKVSERRIINNLSEQFNILGKQVQGAELLDMSLKTKEEKDEIAQRILNFTLKGNPGGLELPESAVMALDMAVSALKRDVIGLLPPDDRGRIEDLDNMLSEQFKLQGKAGDYRDRHLTYEYDDEVPKPAAKAVMLCEMDVSGSMDQETKNTAKVFYWLLSKFLRKCYDQVEIVYISHTTQAQEVDEKTFFYGQESGGTLVSSCLQLAKEIIEKRYPPGEWNIYGAQASDGDSTSSDNVEVRKLMLELLPMLQAHYYIETPNEWARRRGDGALSDLGEVYKQLAEENPGKVYVANNICTPKDALEAFKNFFPEGGTAPRRVFAPSGP